jgi:predicted GNAT family acetyltransferase
MIIRPAQENDNSALTSLHLSKDLEARIDNPLDSRRWRVKTVGSRARDIILVAEEEGEVCGYLWAVGIQLFDYRIGIIFDTFVPSEMRMRGIGRQLLSKALEEFRKMGVHRFWANTDNAAMCSLLESFKFQQSPERVFYDLREPGAQHEWEQV